MTHHEQLLNSPVLSKELRLSVLFEDSFDFGDEMCVYYYDESCELRRITFCLYQMEYTALLIHIFFLVALSQAPLAIQSS